MRLRWSSSTALCHFKFEQLSNSLIKLINLFKFEKYKLEFFFVSRISCHQLSFSGGKKSCSIVCNCVKNLWVVNLN